MSGRLRLLVAAPSSVLVGTLLLAGVAAGEVTPSATEQADAGELPADAQPIMGAVGSVTGSVDAGGDLDLYSFCAGDQGFSLSTVNAATSVDTQLFVFRGDGSALAFNDDRDGTRQSRVTFAPGEVPAGQYLVAVGSFYNTPENAAGQPIFARGVATQSGPSGASDTVLATWDKHARASGAYRIDATGTVDCASSAPVVVGLDVKPGSDRNPINTRSRGRTPFALLGSPEFDVTTVAPETVAVGPGAAPLVGAPTIEDVDGDGHPDLVGHVETQQLGLEPGDTELCVDAAADDTAIRACDAVLAR